MKQAIVALLGGPLKSLYYTYGLPWIEAYAEKHHYDLVIIEQDVFTVFTTNGLVLEYPCTLKSKMPIHFHKYKLNEVLDLYDRICYLDSDMIIKPNCPDLLSIVPLKHLGIFSPVSAQSRIAKRAANHLIKVLREFEKHQIEVPENYIFFNTGVMILERCHQDIFDFSLGAHCSRLMIEQAQLSLNILKKQYTIYSLPISYNFPIGHVTPERGRKAIESDIYVLHYVSKKANHRFIEDSLKYAKRVGNRLVLERHQNAKKIDQFFASPLRKVSELENR